MNEFEVFDFQQLPSLPKKCEGCGVQCALHAKLAGLLMVKHAMQQAAGNLVGEPGEALDAMIDEQLPEDTADQIKQSLRKTAGSNIEAIDATIEAQQQEIDSNALSCSGVLKMRATKDDVTYTVNVCTSPKQYIRDGRHSHMPTHITAASVKKQ